MARTRGGTKVPRSKLKAKPDAQPTRYASDQEEDHNNAEDDSFDARQEAQDDRKPLHNCILCFSAIQEHRNELVNTAKILGAKVDGALTTDVTHLVTESVSMPKYKCAIEWGKPVVTPAWLTELHHQFISGATVQVAELTEKFRLPALSSLRIAITGFPLPPRSDVRAKIISTLTSNGAIYKATFDRSCTHLLCGPEVAVGAKDNKKVNLARALTAQYGVGPAIVWSEWLDDSLWFRGAVEEAPYLVDNPRPAPDRVLQIKSVQPSPTSQLLRQETTMLDGSLSAANARDLFHDLGHSLEKDGQEEAVIKKRKLNRPGASQHLVADLLGWSDLSSNKPSGAPKHKPSSSSLPDLGLPPEKPKLSGLRRAATSASTVPRAFQSSFRDQDVQQTRQRALPLKKAPSVVREINLEPDLSLGLDAAHDSGFDVLSSATKKRSREVDAKSEGADEEQAAPIFEGLTIALVGWPTDAPKGAIDAIHQRKGRVLLDWRTGEHSDVPDWICCPWSNPPLWLDLDDARVVSGHWVERCVYLEELVTDPGSHFALKPMRHGRYPDSEPTKICITGFDPYSSDMVRRMCTYAGIKISKTVEPGQTTELVCDGESGPKWRKAKQLYLPIRKVDWFLQHIRNAPFPEAKKEASKPVLKGVVIALASQLAETVQTRIIRIAESLEAKCMPKYGPDATHFVCSSKKAKDQSKHFKLAKEAGQFIVHPKWLEECARQQKRVDERAFPPAYADDKALSYNVAASPSSLAGAKSQVSSVVSEQCRGSRTPTGKPGEPEPPATNALVSLAHDDPSPPSQLPLPASPGLAAIQASPACSEKRASNPRSVSPLAEVPVAGNASDLNTQYLVEFKGLLAKHASSDFDQVSDAKGKRRRRPLSRTKVGGGSTDGAWVGDRNGQQNESATTSLNEDPTAYLVPDRPSTGRASRPAWEMTQAEELGGDPASEDPAAESLRIAVVDPEAAKAQRALWQTLKQRQLAPSNS